MNVMLLIRQHPLLFADLKNLGVSHNTVHRVASALSTQLTDTPPREEGRGPAFAVIDADEFVRRTSAAPIATELDIAPALVQSMILMIAPWIDRFVQPGAYGRLQA